MADLAIITPSRARPERLREMLRAAIVNAALEIEVWIGLDDDDESEYHDAIDGAFANGADVYVQRMPRRSLSSWTNLLAERCLMADNAPPYLASLGDDHLPRTKSWDLLLVKAINDLDGPGFAYGNDLLQGFRLPTAWVVSAPVVRALGWMMLPTCEHMYVDNAIGELGAAAERISYNPRVIIEHVHPAAGKASIDDSYVQSSSRERYAHDGAAFEAWRDGQLARDAATLRSLKHDHVSVIHN
jgi:hypothetical protein